MQFGSAFITDGTKMIDVAVCLPARPVVDIPLFTTNCNITTYNSSITKENSTETISPNQTAENLTKSYDKSSYIIENL